MADTNSSIKWFWQYPLSSPYGTRTHPVTGQPNKFHAGNDWAMPNNEKIYSHIEGTVTTSSYSGGYGNLVVVKDANGYSHYFAHMNKTAVSVGDTITKGTLLGYVGSTGQSTGPHLHYEVRNASGNNVDSKSFSNIDGVYNATELSSSGSNTSNIFSSSFWKEGLLTLMKYIVIVLLIILFVILITLSMDEI